MKRLLIATDNFLPRQDGIASFLSEVIPGLRDEYEITVLGPSLEGPIPEISGVTIHRFPMSKTAFGDFTLAKPIMKTIQAHVDHTDLVWTQTIGPIGFWTIMAARKRKKPVAAFIHSLEWELFSKSVRYGRGIVSEVTKVMVWYVYNKCTLLMVPSLEVGELLTLRRIWPKKHVVPLGIDIQHFRPPESKADAKRRLGITPHDKVIGFVGRLAREKDLSTLSDAFLRIHRKHRNTKLLIVGDGLPAIKEKLVMHQHVILPGAVRDVAPYLQAMDVFVLPSLTETTSLATLEAMSCGLPVICTPVGNIRRYIKDKKNGFLFPKRNSLVLSLKLDWVLRNSFLRDAVGRAARKTVEEGFSWSTTLHEIKEALNEL